MKITVDQTFTRTVEVEVPDDTDFSTQSGVDAVLAAAEVPLSLAPYEWCSTTVLNEADEELFEIG